MIYAIHLKNRLYDPDTLTVHSRHLDLLDLRPQLLQRPMTVDAIRDVIPKTVAQHPLSICFPHGVALTQSAEGVAAGVRGSLRQSQLSQCVLHIPSEL